MKSVNRCKCVVYMGKLAPMRKARLAEAFEFCTPFGDHKPLFCELTSTFGGRLQCDSTVRSGTPIPEKSTPIEQFRNVR
jgi:hypothetical protein